MRIPVFGDKKDGIEYIRRPAVYGLMFNEANGKIGIIQCDGEYFLPGGGIEENETHEQCLKREAIEEMGMEVEMGAFIGRANRYFYSTGEFVYYLNEGYFYLCKMGRQLGEPLESDHFLFWLEPPVAMERLFHEHQSWAVNEALKLIASRS